MAAFGLRSSCWKWLTRGTLSVVNCVADMPDCNSNASQRSCNRGHLRKREPGATGLDGVLSDSQVDYRKETHGVFVP